MQYWLQALDPEWESRPRYLRSYAKSRIFSVISTMPNSTKWLPDLMYPIAWQLFPGEVSKSWSLEKFFSVENFLRGYVIELFSLPNKVASFQLSCKKKKFCFWMISSVAMSKQINTSSPYINSNTIWYNGIFCSEYSTDRKPVPWWDIGHGVRLQQLWVIWQRYIWFNAPCSMSFYRIFPKLIPSLFKDTCISLADGSVSNSCSAMEQYFIFCKFSRIFQHLQQ